MATASAARARAIFSSSASWGSQHQVGFVFESGELPILERRLVVEIIAARDAELAGLDLPARVSALVLPAVDGDFVEIVARTTATRDRIREAIASECGGRGISFRLRSGMS